MQPSHPLTHCHWTTWMCCLAWSWLSIFTRLSYGLNVLSSPDYSLVSWSGVKILIELDVNGVNWSEYQSWWAALTLSSLAPLCSADSAACLSRSAALFPCNYLTCLSSTFIPFISCFGSTAGTFSFPPTPKSLFFGPQIHHLTQITKLVS